MDSFNISFQAPVRHTGNSFKPKNVVQQTNKESTFSKLFQSTSSDHQHVNGEQKQADTLKKIEETLAALQELPKDSLSPEELGALAAMLQMLAQQTAETLDKQQGSQSQSFMGALRQIEKQLDELSALSTINIDEPVHFVGVEEKELFSNSEQKYIRFDSLLSQLEFEQKSEGSLQQVESFEKLIQQLTTLIDEVAQVTEQEQLNGPSLKIEPSLPLTGAQGANEIESNEILLKTGNTGLKPEQALDQNNSQVITVSAVQDPQGGQKTETNAQNSTVRFNHLIEDLSEVFRGTFRLNSNLEGTQLRVNIFPEHLGHLDIRLTSLDGKITAQIFTASLTTKEALDLQVQQLRNSLMQQGISIEKIEIEHQNSQHSFGQQHANPDQRFAQHQQKQGNSTRNGNGYLLMEEELPAERKPLSEGSVQVNYTI